MFELLVHLLGWINITLYATAALLGFKALSNGLNLSLKSDVAVDLQKYSTFLFSVGGVGMGITHGAYMFSGVYLLPLQESMTFFCYHFVIALATNLFHLSVLIESNNSNGRVGP